MNDVTTLLLNSIGAGNRGEGRGQEAATKQGNGQLFGELMNQQIAARTSRPEQTKQTQGQKQPPEKQPEEKLVKEKADTSSNPVNSPKNDQDTKKASQDQQDEKIIAEDATTASDKETAQSVTSKDNALGQQADLNTQPIQNPPVLLPQVMPNSVDAEALPANPNPQTIHQSANQAVQLINSASSLTDMEGLQANGVGQPLTINGAPSDSSFAQLPAPNPLTKADDALAQMDILGQQDTEKQNTTTVDANLLPDTTIGLQSSTQQNLAIQQPLEPLPTPLANDAQPSTGNVTTNTDVLAPAPAKTMVEVVATSPDHDLDNSSLNKDPELSAQHQSHDLSGKEDGAAPLTTPNLVQSPVILQTIDGTKQVAQVAIDPQQSGALAQQVTFAIRKGANEGTSQMHIKLNPIELGGIDIRMEVDADHHVRAILTIERPETYDLLHKDAQHLQKLLGESGLKLADANAIQYEQRSASNLASNSGNSTQDWLGSGWFGQQGQAGRHAQNDSGYSAARHPSNDGDDIASTSVNLITYTHGQADGRVNIRV